jgi:hypothetical protein
MDAQGPARTGGSFGIVGYIVPAKCSHALSAARWALMSRKKAIPGGWRLNGKPAISDGVMGSDWFFDYRSHTCARVRAIIGEVTSLPITN